jgi:hypothetical protein
MVKEPRIFRSIRGGALLFSCSLLACNQPTNFSKLEASSGKWQERYDHACRLSSASKRKLSSLTGEFQFDGEGEFPDALAVGSKRYLAIFKRNFNYSAASGETFEIAVASPIRESIKGIVYDGKTTCGTVGPRDGTVFILSIGKPLKSQLIRDQTN